METCEIADAMEDATLTTRLAILADVDPIVALSARVQAMITASGSLQIIGPLEHEMVTSAINEKRCYVLDDSSHRIQGCMFVRYIDVDGLASTPEFNLTSFPRPWHLIHRVMLAPAFRGRGIGVRFFEDVVRYLAPLGGTIVLDTWVGNHKVRAFWERCGCRYVATIPEQDFEVAVFVRDLGDGVR